MRMILHVLECLGRGLVDALKTAIEFDRGMRGRFPSPRREKQESPYHFCKEPE